MKRLVLLCLAVLCAGCPAEETGPCASDADCPAGSACDAGVCVCVTDEACAPGSFCNPQHVCQLRQGCRSSEDCGDELTCDLPSGACVAAGSCEQDLQCAVGSICAGGSCVPGCRTAADCPLGSACRSDGGRGTCDVAACEDGTFCEPGLVCREGGCVTFDHPTHCSSCDGTPCGDGAICVANVRHPSLSTEEAQCGALCDDAGDCPGSHSCRAIGGATCERDRDCADFSYAPSCLGTCTGSNASCFDDSNCGAGSRCDAGRRRCVDDGRGSCTSDADCGPTPLCTDFFGTGSKICLRAPFEACRTSADCLCGEDGCMNTPRACGTAADCDVPCVGGTCIVGRACVPFPELACEDLR